MHRFKPGQKVVCIKEGMWTNSIFGPNNDGPKYGEIVTVHGYSPINPFTHVELAEYRIYKGTWRSFNEIQFEPLMDITELTEILEKQEATA